MACDLYLAPSFSQLEGTLLDRLEATQEMPTCAPIWVVVPTSTLARHLRHRAARLAQSHALAGVRIVPLEVLVGRLRSKLEAPTARWEPVLDLLLQEAATRIPPTSALSQLRREPEAFGLLKPTFRDLADAGFGPQQLGLLHELAELAELRTVERDLLRVFAGWVHLLAEASVPWQPLADQRLPAWIEAVAIDELHRSMGAEPDQQAQLLLHGFYELTDVNTDIICALSRRLAVSLFFPNLETEGLPHPAYQFASSYLEELKLRLGVGLGGIRAEEPITETARFFATTFPEGSVGEQPDWLTHQSACGRRAEVVAAAARVRAWIDAPDSAIAPDEIVVAVPEPESYVDVIREVFGQFAIPVRMADVPVTLSAQSRPLRLLMRLWREQAPAELLLAYLREVPQLAGRRGIDLEHFESEVRRARCWGGPSFDALVDMSAGGLTSLTESETSFLTSVVRMWTGPRALSRPIHQWVEWVEELETDWVEDTSLLEPVADGLRQAATLRPQLELQSATLHRLLMGASSSSQVSDPADQTGVTVVPLMRARGLTCQAMVLLGLAAGTFPVQLDEDPLLSDQSRRRLRVASGQAGHRLAIRSAVTDEMALLFMLLNTATQEVHWVVPETDELGKSVSPTPWVQRYQQRWSEGAFPRMPRGPRQQAATLLRMGPDGQVLPPSLGFLLDHRLADLVGDAAHYAHVARTRRLQEIQPDWQGFIRAPGWKQPLPDPDDPPRISVTRLESLARCPYRFYAGQLAGWAPLELVQFSADLRPLEWGSLVHRFLESILNPAVGQSSTLGDRAAELLADSSASLRRLSSQLPPKLSPSFRFLPPVLADATRWRLFRLVSNYLEHIGTSCSDGRLESQELHLRRGFPELAPLLISGIVDRVDLDDTHGRSVVDYKTGRPPWSSKRRRDTEVSLGFFMQPWLYPWLLPPGDEPQPVGFRYVFLGGDDPIEVPIQLPGETDALLEPLGKILREGFFFPTSTETLSRALGQSVQPCLYCDLPSLCRRFEGRRTRQALRWLLTWVPERFGLPAPEEPT